MGDVKPWSMGENPYVSTLFEFPSSLVDLFIAFVEVVGAVMVGSGVWQAVSLCPRAHSTSELSSRWQATSTAILSTMPLFPRSVHSHAGTRRRRPVHLPHAELIKKGV